MELLLVFTRLWLGLEPGAVVAACCHYDWIRTMGWLSVRPVCGVAPVVDSVNHCQAATTITPRFR